MDDRGKLVLGLKEGDTVRIGDDIEITILRSGYKTDVLFLAPKTTRILRSSLEQASNAKSNSIISPAGRRRPV